MIYKNKSIRKNFILNPELSEKLDSLKDKINQSALVRELLESYFKKNPQLFN